MLSTHLGPSGDLASWAVWLAVGLTLVSFVMLLVEMRRRERGGVAIALTGLLAVVALLAAVLRPARVSARESLVGARVVVLADTSRSMALEQPGGRRWQARDRAIAALAKASTIAPHRAWFRRGLSQAAADDRGWPRGRATDHACAAQRSRSGAARAVDLARRAAGGSRRR